MSKHRHRRRWLRLGVAVAVGALLGAGVEHVAHELNKPEHSHAETVVTQTVAATPKACREAIKQAADGLELAKEFGDGMKSLHGRDGGLHSFRKGGAHYRDSEKFLDDLKEIVEDFDRTSNACKSKDDSKEAD